MRRLVAKCERGEYALPCSQMDVYEFGVFAGASVKAMTQYLDEHATPFRRFHGFDSFEGLPAEDAALVRGQGSHGTASFAVSLY